MTLVIATYVPEGVAMVSDSRQSIVVSGKGPDGKDFSVETVNSDAVTKTFLLDKFRVGVSSFGVDLLGGVPIASHIKSFSEKELDDNDDVETIAKKLVKYISQKFGGVDSGFHVCGYKKEEGVSVPYIYYCHVAKNEVLRKNVKPDCSVAYGSTWSGQADVINGLVNPVLVTNSDGTSKIIRSVAPIIWDAMPLQDAVDFSVFAVRTTIDTIRFQARPKNVGGDIDVLVITPDSAYWVKRKELFMKVV